MVLFKVPVEEYSAGVLTSLNKLRSEFHDVILTVGTQKINAHKNILVVGSDYFKSLFAGPFVDSDKSQVDLSKTIDDATIVESVVNFLYSGEIEIDDTNLESLMKLSSYLLIRKLEGFCEEYIIKHTYANLSSCIKFYLFCMKYGFVKLEDKLFRIVNSRLNDIIKKDLDLLEPCDIRTLYKKGSFKYCVVENIISFLLTWLDNSITEESLQVAHVIVDYIQDKKLSTEVSEVQKAVLERLERKLGDSKCGKHLCQRFQALLRTYDTGKSSKPKDLYFISGSYEGIIVLAPRRCLIDKHPISFALSILPRRIEEPVVDVCVYVPELQSWYLLNQFYDRGVIKEILEDSGNNGYLYVDRKVFYMHYEDVAPVSFSLSDPASKGTEYNHDHISANPDEYLYCSESHLVSSKDNNVYVVHRINISSHLNGDDDSSRSHFQCCQLVRGKKWKPVFTTETLDIICDGTHAVAISSISNELLIIYYFRGVVCSYMADMSKEVPTICQVAPVKDPWSRREEEDYKDIKILEGKDRFFVIEIGKQDDRKKISCTYQYIYKSNNLEACSGSEIFLSDLTVDFDKHGSFYPCCFGLNILDKAIWIFDGNSRCASSLTEIVISDDGKLETRTHTPPPFSYSLAGFPAKISKKSLALKKPITSFLQLKN